MEEVPKETDGTGFKVLQQAVQTLEIPVQGFTGYCCPIFTEMADFTKVYIADPQGVFPFPIHSSPGMQNEPFSAKVHQMRHVFKGIK